MITKVSIRNFMSIKEADVELARINILFGKNMTGKRNFMYALVKAGYQTIVVGDKEYRPSDVSDYCPDATVKVVCDDPKKDLEQLTIIPTFHYYAHHPSIASKEDMHKVVNRYTQRIFNSYDVGVFLDRAYYTTPSVDRVIHVLSRIVAPFTSLIVLDCPEVGLHPITIKNFIEAIAELVLKYEKQIIIKTYNELVIGTFLGLVATNTIKPSDIKCYKFTKQDGTVIIENKKINEKGQIEGGLVDFMEPELENLRRLLGVDVS